MNEIGKTNLSDQTKFRLNEKSKIQNYFNSEINQRKLCSKKLSKYVSAFDYIDKIFIVLNTTTGGVYIISHATKRKIMIKFLCWLKVYSIALKL